MISRVLPHLRQNFDRITRLSHRMADVSDAPPSEARTQDAPPSSTATSAPASTDAIAGAAGAADTAAGDEVELLDLPLRPDFPRFTPNRAVRELPLAEFTRYYDLALRSDAGWPGAHNFVLSTVDGRSWPDSRTVSLLTYTDDGFVFSSSSCGPKAEQLRGNEHCAMLFHWPSLRMQVRVRGVALQLSRPTVEVLFARCRLEERCYSWSCAQAPDHPFRQSAVVTSDKDAERWAAEVAGRFSAEDLPPLPACWSAWLIVPVSVEFFGDSRVRYRLAHGEPAIRNEWIVEHLAR